MEREEADVTLVLPFLFPILYVRRRGRRVHELYAKGHAPFRLRSFSAGGSPPTTRWTRARTADAAGGRPEASDTRTYGGQSFGRLEERGRGIGPIELEGVFDSWAMWMRRLPKLPFSNQAPPTTDRGLPYGFPTMESLRRLPDVSSARKLWDGAMDAMSDAAETWRSGVVFVDGEAWVAVDEPFHRVVASPGRDVVVDVAIAREFPLGGVPFAAGRGDEALAYAEALAGAAGTRVKVADDVLEAVAEDVAFRAPEEVAGAVVDAFLYGAGWEGLAHPFQGALEAVEELAEVPARRRDCGWATAAVARVRSALRGPAVPGTREGNCAQALAYWDLVHGEEPPESDVLATAFG